MPIDAEVLKAIADAVAAALKEGEAERGKAMQTALHSAVVTHLKDIRGKIVEELKGSIGELVPSGDALKTLIADAVKANAPPDDGRGSKSPQPPAGPSPEVAALTRTVNELTTKLKTEGDARAASERQRRDDAAYADLRTHLGAGKVRPEMLDTLAKVLFHADKRVEFEADTNRPLFKIRRAPMAGMAETDELLPLDAGVAEYLKSKDAEPFLPAPTARPGARPAAPTRPGQGAGGKTYDKPATSDGEKVRRAGEREAALAQQFPHLAR
jgi:hypothetical protein